MELYTQIGELCKYWYYKYLLKMACMTYFSEQLANRCKELGWTAYQLGKAAGLNVRYCYKLLNGTRSPNDDTLRKLADTPGLELNMETLRVWRASIDIMQTLDRLPAEEVMRWLETRPDILEALRTRE